MRFFQNKSFVFFLILALILFSLNIETAHANVFKKIGKAIGKVGKAIGKAIKDVGKVIYNLGTGILAAGFAFVSAAVGIVLDGIGAIVGKSGWGRGLQKAATWLGNEASCRFTHLSQEYLICTGKKERKDAKVFPWMPRIVSTPIITTPSVTCSANPSSPQVNDKVIWLTSITGGKPPYTYSWSGTDGLSGSTAGVEKIYTTSGIKNATVEVKDSENNTFSGSCDVTVAEELPEDFMVSCSGFPLMANVNQEITWSATITGGKSPFTYSWSGTDGLSGSTADIKKIYTSQGIKSATINVTDSDNKTSSYTCIVAITADPGTDGTGPKVGHSDPIIQPEIKEVAP